MFYDHILAKMSARSPRKIFLGTEDVHLREAENALFFFCNSNVSKVNCRGNTREARGFQKKPICSVRLRRICGKLLNFFFTWLFISHQSNEIGHAIGLLPLFVKSIHIFKCNNI